MKRFLAVTGMVLAVLGVILCIEVIVGGWLLRGSVNNAVREMLPGVNQTLDESVRFLNRTETLLDSANSDVGRARTRLQGISDTTSTGVAAVTNTVNTVVQTVVEPVRYVRSEIAALRGSILLFSSFFNGLPSFLNTPDIPVERLQAMDERARAIDEQVAAIEDSVNTAQENVTQTRATVTAALDAVQSNLSTLGDAADEYSTTLGALQRSLPGMQSRINFWLTFLAIQLTLLGLCGSALFVQLYHAASREWNNLRTAWTTDHSTTTTTSSRTQTLDGAEVVTTTVTVTESKTKRPAVLPSAAEAGTLESA